MKTGLMRDRVSVCEKILQKITAFNFRGSYKTKQNDQSFDL